MDVLFIFSAVASRMISIKSVIHCCSRLFDLQFHQLDNRWHHPRQSANRFAD